MRNALSIFIVLICACASPGEIARGVSLAHIHHRGAGYGSEDCRRELKRISDIGANWVALNDFAYMRDVDQPGLVFDRDPTMTRQDIIQSVRDAHAVGLKVLIKPHIWSNAFWSAGKWHGDIKMKTEVEWDAWFDAYTQYVLYNASIAAESNADAVSVGVELEGTSGQSARWRKLIKAVREVYKGPVCYSAAFLEWKRIDWWDAVDIIGITAYWPVSQKTSPDEATLREGWKKIFAELDGLHARTGKPICFTELGYTPSEIAAREPWAYTFKVEDAALQARLYSVAIDEASKRDYMRGVFVWKWFSSSDWQRHENGDAFAVQNRPLVLEALQALWRR